jgi:hypothetical protein
MRRTTILAAGVLALLLTAAAEASPPPAKPAGVTWAGTHFTTPTSLSRWLGRHGVRYRDWARRHPRGRYLMTHPATVPPRRVTAPRPRSTPPPGSPAATARSSSPLVIVFLAIGALLFILAAAGNQIAWLTHAPIPRETVATARFRAASLGVAVLVALALARSL